MLEKQDEDNTGKENQVGNGEGPWERRMNETKYGVFCQRPL